MRHSTIQNGNFHQILLGCFHAFGNGCCYFSSLTKSPTNDTITITNYNNGSESKRSTTLSYLGNTIDSNQSVF